MCFPLAATNMPMSFTNQARSQGKAIAVDSDNSDGIPYGDDVREQDDIDGDDGDENER